MSLPKLIENNKCVLSKILNEIANNRVKLSIATGYWDIFGTAEIIDSIKNYKSIRLLIGQEPQHNPYIKKILADHIEFQNVFPDNFFKSDLENIELNDAQLVVKNTATILSQLIKDKVLEVKVFRNPRLHAKAYIFGDYESDNAIGIVGSSNFTLAGLTNNAELNAVEDDYRIVTYKPQSENQENGHLSWFDDLWNSEEAIEWSGDFQRLIEESPVGDMTFGAYDVYIKTLMEVYPDEMLPPKELSQENQDVLYSFQNRNAGILINKLNKMKLAILSDSVGLGKTITAGAVIKHYIDTAKDGHSNVLIIAPAALKQQWQDDLADVIGLERIDGDYDIISQQDSNAIYKTINYYNREKRKTRKIDLFVIDEAHNLRNKSGTRHDAILELLQQHPDAHILLLTATPINNSLMDIANLIEIASKGNIKSVNVQYARPDGSNIESIDFFEALKRIQSSLNRTKTSEESKEILNKYKSTIHNGLRHYLVRSTRQGVEAEGGIVDKSGNKKAFPKSIVESINYQYSKDISKHVYDLLKQNKDICFEGFDTTKLNLILMGEFTQQTMHPLDFLPLIVKDPLNIQSLFNIENDLKEELLIDEVKSLVPNLLQAIFTLGFAPYRYDMYQHKYYGKTINEIRSFQQVQNSLKIQLSVHNILQITWLKRLESSPSALLNSINNYLKRIELFTKYLNRGFIISLSDATLLESDYNDGEDIDQAFDDFNKYLHDREQLLESGKNPDELKKQGVEKIIASRDVYNVDQIKKDISRDIRIVSLLKEILLEVSNPINDIKMQSLHKHIQEVLQSKKHGEKVIVFSFFADTIKHLEENFNNLYLEDREYYIKQSAFITGQSRKVEEMVSRFSPVSKKYTIKPNEQEINFLFATDVLSEGQNLQDAGYLVNYDLHWNPVRMIQRNGRINRLGSQYSEVLIGNMKPTDELELYLNLVNRLENKIQTIRNTVGLDQGVLSNEDVNPINFIENYYRNGDLPMEDDLLAHTDEHILALRRFIGINGKNQKEIDRVKGMPKGKWNYLPEVSRSIGTALSLVKVTGKTVEKKREFTDLFFVKVDTTSENYVTEYIDLPIALDKIRADVSENSKLIDRINYNRVKVLQRSKAEAIRQTNNSSDPYTLTQQYLKALLLFVDYFPRSEDLVGTIQRGVTTSNLKSELQTVLKKALNDAKNEGVITALTVNSFTLLFNRIKENEVEEKEVESVEAILYYSGS